MKEPTSHWKLVGTNETRESCARWNILTTTMKGVCLQDLSFWARGLRGVSWSRQCLFLSGRKRKHYFDISWIDSHLAKRKGSNMKIFKSRATHNQHNISNALRAYSHLNSNLIAARYLEIDISAGAVMDGVCTGRKWRMFTVSDRHERQDWIVVKKGIDKSARSIYLHL